MEATRLTRRSALRTCKERKVKLNRLRLNERLLTGTNAHQAMTSNSLLEPLGS
jgi:hypothetical protein